MDGNFDALSKAIQSLIEVTDISGDYTASEGDEDEFELYDSTSWSEADEPDDGRHVRNAGDGTDDDSEDTDTDQELEDLDNGDLPAEDASPNLPRQNPQVNDVPVVEPDSLSEALELEQGKLRVADVSSLEIYLDRVVSHLIALESVRANIEKMIK